MPPVDLSTALRYPHAHRNQGSVSKGRSRRLDRVAAMVALAGLALVVVGSAGFRPAAAHRQDVAASPGAFPPCGETATRWSEASANGISAHLVRLEPHEPSLAGDPPDHRRVAARLAIANQTAAPLPLGPTAFALVACDGTIYPPVADSERRAPPADLPAGRAALGWVTFALPVSAEPALLILRFEAGETCRAALSFPLVLSETDAPTEVPSSRGATGPLARFLTPCEGGSAGGGAATGDEADAIGADGRDGVEGDTLGGDGCPGQDATGSGAIGGDGGDGGDAIGNGDAIGGAAPDCQTEHAE